MSKLFKTLFASLFITAWQFAGAEVIANTKEGDKVSDFVTFNEKNLFSNKKKADIPLPPGEWTVRIVERVKSTHSDPVWGISLALDKVKDNVVSEMIGIHTYDQNQKNWNVTCPPGISHQPNLGGVDSECFSVELQTFMGDSAAVVQTKLRKKWNEAGISWGGNAFSSSTYIMSRSFGNFIIEYFIPTGRFLDESKRARESPLHSSKLNYANEKVQSLLPAVREWYQDYFKRVKEGVYQAKDNLPPARLSSGIRSVVPDIETLASQATGLASAAVASELGKDGKYEGQGTIAAANGTVSSQAILSVNQPIRPSNPETATISDSQRLENERKAAQLEQERVRLAQERERLDADKLQREQAKKATRIAIQAATSQPDALGEFSITIRTNTSTSSLKINGQEIGGADDLLRTYKLVARAGQDTKVTIVAQDQWGNTDTNVLIVSRALSTAKEIPPPLNAANLRRQPPRNAVAIIIGIQDYQSVPPAEFAKDDALVFYDYALRLGIRPEDIHMLLDAKADYASMFKAFKNWLPSRVRKDLTDVYVFYSGHGLTDDGKIYLLPYGVDKDLLERTAIAQKDLVKLLQDARPKSVTMFMDSCYSGQTRGNEALILSAKPLFITVEEKAYPDNFTIMSASASNQMSSSSPDLKHGIFSYYLMKGLEGDAAEKKDGAITVGNLQNYLSEKVPRFAMQMSRKQEPQLIGDGTRVLISN